MSARIAAVGFPTTRLSGRQVASSQSRDRPDRRGGCRCQWQLPQWPAARLLAQGSAILLGPFDGVSDRLAPGITAPTL
jgi:hypothetical protein